MSAYDSFSSVGKPTRELHAFLPHSQHGINERLVVGADDSLGADRKEDTSDPRAVFKDNFPMLDKCFSFHALDPRSVSTPYTCFVVVALLSCYIFTFPPAERFIIYVSDSVYFLEWLFARRYLSSSTHFFDRAMVVLKYELPEARENDVLKSVAITITVVIVEKIVWFDSNGLASSPDSAQWWLEIWASATFIWRLHCLFVIAAIVQLVIASHVHEIKDYCSRMKTSAIQFVSEFDRATAIKEHAGILDQIIQTSSLLSAPMGVSIAISLLSVVLILWYTVAGATPLILLLAVFDYIINYMLCLASLLAGASLSTMCHEPYKIMLRMVSQGGLSRDTKDDTQPPMPSSSDTLMLLQYFKMHSDGLKIFGIPMTRNEIGRSLYLFVTIIAVVLLQVTPLGK